MIYEEEKIKKYEAGLGDTHIHTKNRGKKHSFSCVTNVTTLRSELSRQDLKTGDSK